MIDIWYKVELINENDDTIDVLEFDLPKKYTDLTGTSSMKKAYEGAEELANKLSSKELTIDNQKIISVAVVEIDDGPFGGDTEIIAEYPVND